MMYNNDKSVKVAYLNEEEAANCRENPSTANGFRCKSVFLEFQIPFSKIFFVLASFSFLLISFIMAPTPGAPGSQIANINKV